MESRDKERYSRQILFSGIGEAGQERILGARVVLAGCGALGTVQAGLLARAGVGRLRIIDRDYVELSNLQRQTLFEEEDAARGLPKSIAAAAHLKRINSSCQVEPVVADLTPSSVDELLGDADVILDATDNFETRYLMNEFAIRQNKPWIYGAAVGSYGLTMPILPGFSSCFRCVYPEPPGGVQPTCETAGVLGSVTSIIASLQVADALQILAAGGPSLPLRITTVDVWSGAVRKVSQPAQDPECPACVHKLFPYLEGRFRKPISLCGRNAVQIHERERPIDLAELHARLEPLGEVRSNGFALRFFLPPYEMTVFPDGRAIIKGTTDIGIARSFYSRFLGA